jgi:hypothetical protein
LSPQASDRTAILILKSHETAAEDYGTRGGPMEVEQGASNAEEIVDEGGGGLGLLLKRHIISLGNASLISM